MTPTEIIEHLKRLAGTSITAAVADGPHPHVVAAAERLVEVATILKTDPQLRFDLLRCISAIDWPAQNSIELSYDLLSTSLCQAFALKVRLERADPQIASLVGVWPAAEWHERETFDLMGVMFLRHPDPRRILLPEDWVGHPLRKDYAYPEEYKGLKLQP